MRQGFTGGVPGQEAVPQLPSDGCSFFVAGVLSGGVFITMATGQVGPCLALPK